MLANIFGLHIGCKVRFEDEGDMVEGVIDTVAHKDTPTILVELDNPENEWNDCVIVDIEEENPKLLLKPLSAITEEHKESFKNEFGYRFIWLAFYDKKLCLLAPNGEPFDFVSERGKLFLRSLGYDIPDGLVPDEYKKVSDE